MKNVTEVKKSIEILSDSPAAFASIAHHIIVSDGTPCWKPEPAPETEAAVIEALKDKKLHDSYYELLREYFGKSYLRESFIIKDLSRILDSMETSDDIHKMIMIILNQRIRDCELAVRSLQMFKEVTQ